MDDRKLLQRAIEARQLAYCPYSEFAVGAALLCTDGTVITGVNVENAVNGLSICAERVALFTAISMGKRDFLKLAVVCNNEPCRPCGACRQVLYEHAPGLEIIMGNLAGDYEKISLRELLPQPFEL